MIHGEQACVCNVLRSLFVSNPPTKTFAGVGCFFPAFSTFAISELC
jgi:hypothetical protein